MIFFQMPIAAHIGIEKACHTVNSPPLAHAFGRLDIVIFIHINRCVCQAPFQHRVVVVDDFFAGNKEWWDNRFVSTDNGAEITKGGKYKYFNNGHYIICGDRIRHNDGFDNDAKTVWTNFTPFSTKGKATINNDHYKKSVPKIVELINILSPKRIYLFGKDSFNFFTDYQNCVKIERKKILKDNLEDGILEIGEINGIPAIQLPHPSIKWRFHKIFVPLFAEMWRNCLKEKLPLDELSIKMRKQLTRLVPIED